MAITITDDFLKEVKQHMRIAYDTDDILIKTEIEVAITNIYEMLMLTKNLPTTTANLTSRQSLAVKHYVLMLRSNPDGSIQTRATMVDTRLIRRILGSELRYIPEDTTSV